MKNPQLIGSRGKSFEHLPRLEQSNQVEKILNQLSTINHNNLESQTPFLNNHSLSLKLYKYDLDAKQRCKLQLKSHNSPSKWKGNKIHLQKSSYQLQFIVQKGKAYENLLSHLMGHVTSEFIKKKLRAAKMYQFPLKQEFHGVKSNYFSRQFPQDLTKANSKKYNKKLKQIQLQYENKVFQGRLKSIEERKQRSIEAIRSRGTRFQLSKEKLFGFVNLVKNSPNKHIRFSSTISGFYKKSSPNKNN